MIEEIRIEDLGVIERAALELGEGLSVITGETGAGKTMILTALSLLLGGTPDPGLVRVGAERAVVEGRIVVAADSSAAARARDAGGELDDDVLLLARTIAARGRSRAFLGGRSVPRGVLAEVGDDLVTVHGQSDQHRLRAPATQREALDAFAGPEHAALLADYREAFAEHRRAVEELAAWQTGERERAREMERLAAALAEIEDADPQPGEDLALRAESDRLANVEELRRAVGSAAAALSGGADAASGRSGASDAISALDGAERALDLAQAHDATLTEWVQRLAGLGYQLADLATEVRRYLDGLEADPDRLEAVHARRAQLTALARVYGVRWEESSDEVEAGSIEAVLAWARHARTRLAQLTDPSAGSDALAERVELCRDRCARAQSALSMSRAAAALQLGQAVGAELVGLAMTNARLEVALVPLAEPGPWGAEAVELRLAGHPGAPARPLAATASGGELSRVMLAIEVVLAGARGGPARTFVFDEVDAGVGGKAGQEVGRRLATLARESQVVVVTHLAQVAAFADHHLLVTRSDDAAGVTTHVRHITGADRESELARMLSGDQASLTARRHAASLIEQSRLPAQGGVAH